MSVADLYFIQEFAKLATSSDGVLDARKFKADARTILFSRDQKKRKAQRSPDAQQSDLESERSPLLMQYFAEEFEKLNMEKPTAGNLATSPMSTVSRRSSASLLTQRRPDVENSTARRRSTGELDLDALDRSYLLFTSEAYLVLNQST